MARRPAERKPLPQLLKLLWRSPLYAVPFALFFGTLYGAGARVYRDAYLMALFFAYVIGLCLWLHEHLVFPRMMRPSASGRTPPDWMINASFAVVSIVGTFLAALIVHLTILPGFLGSARSIALMGMFALIFSGLFTGVFLAIRYYRETIDKVKAEEELNLARRIQRSFLISNFPSHPRLDVHALNVSSKQVSGDFYDVVPTGDNAFLLAIADVAGKGVPAALLSSMLQASLRTQANSERSVAAILRNINALVYRSTAVQQFATFFLARIEEDTLALSFTNAGHNYPVVFRRDGDRQMLVKGGVVVGILENVTFEEERVTLQPGDRLVFYTDGVTEAANAKGELFGEERLYDLVQALPATLPANEVTQHILDGVRTFLDGTEAGDDITLMVLRVHDPPAAAPTLA